MKKLIILIVCAFCFSVSGLLASEIHITYITGECNVDLYGNGRWQDAAVDMDLNQDSIVKTGLHGELELDIDGSTVSIGPGSTVSIDSLLEKVTEKRKLRWLKRATRYVKAVGKEDEQWSETALTGVRGDKAEEDELEWIVDFEDDEFTRGKGLFEEGDYTESVKVFNSILERDGIGAEGGEAAYYLGVSLFNSLRYKDALPYLVESTKDNTSPFYDSALMNYSFTHYFLRNYKEAIEGFSSYINAFSDGEFAPYALLMLGKCYKDMGLKQEARVYFTRIEKDYRDSDVYSDAVEELRD
jgi:TolA-binding protein